MSRFRAATRVVAFFMMGICGSPLVHGEDDGYPNAVPAVISADSLYVLEGRRPVGSVDVTAAVDSATALIVDAVRGLRRFVRFGAPSGEVDIADVAQLDATQPFNTALALAELSFAYDTGYDSGPRAGDLPALQHNYSWQLTYRSDVPDSLAPHADLQFDRYPGMNITLDDSVVVGLRFEWDYGWKR